jgi:hypothetical protein
MGIDPEDLRHEHVTTSCARQWLSLLVLLVVLVILLFLAALVFSIAYILYLPDLNCPALVLTYSQALSSSDPSATVCYCLANPN